MKKNIKSNLFTVRPKYRRLSPLPPCHVTDKLQEKLIKAINVRGQVKGNDALLKFHKNKTNFWSPEFGIHVIKRGKGSTITGVMSPNSVVLTIIILLSVVSIILFFLGFLMFVYQWIFHIESPFAWCIPMGLIIALIDLFFVNMNKFKGKKQMTQLLHFVDLAIDEREMKQKKLLDDLFPEEDFSI